MKVLMLTPYLPYPPTSGGQVRSYNLIKNLSKKHDITLFSLIKNETEKEYVKELQKYCKKVFVFARPARPWTIKNIIKTGFSAYPFLVVRNLCPEEKNAICKELSDNQYDIIHAENFYVMPHLPKTKIPVLLTEQTILYRVFQHYVETLPWYFFWLKPILMIDVLKLRYMEIFFWKTANWLAAVSENDANIITKLTGRKQVSVVPNGVDFAYYSHNVNTKLTKPTVLFGAADFHWMQNEEGAKLLLDIVWPKIKRLVPNASLWIVGKIAPKVLKRYLRLPDVIIEEIANNRDAYQKSWILVAPMKSGGGSRTKLFEAMASGIPIVTTSEGMEGIDAKNGKEVIIENNLDKLAAQAAKLLTNTSIANKIGTNAQKLANKSYDWSQSAYILNNVYEQIGKQN